MEDKNLIPDIPQVAPYSLKVEEGKTYYWCACGKSSKQPFCDGSHKETGFAPIAYKATKTRQVFFCGCKLTKRPPLCDGEHARLIDG
ncbi:CDGSH iron-sulfur domain-containing protein [Curvivirga sp.]|uniref:CDGSH iron-sulfur domain-containing protein n=1 Tax=Curvivirga sp. TaxID=2856848 RepID=UPI003B5ADC8D